MYVIHPMCYDVKPSDPEGNHIHDNLRMVYVDCTTVYCLPPTIVAPALMALWSKTLSLNDSCPSQLPMFESHSGHVRKLSVTKGKTVVFAGYSCFLLASYTTKPIYGRKSDEKQNSEFHQP